MPRFAAPDGKTYRVADIVFGIAPASPGRAVRLPFGDPRASARLFLPVGGPGAGEHEVAIGGTDRILPNPPPDVEVRMSNNSVAGTDTEQILELTYDPDQWLVGW